MRFLVFLWLITSAILGIELLLLNHQPDVSFLFLLKHRVPFFSALSLDPAPGKQISYALGWIGFGVMALTNFYVFRKRWFRNSPKLGSMKRWLNFHIFFGLMGPSLILAHTNLAIAGIAGISFWCMVISFWSGIVGRYFYLQLVEQKSDLENSYNEYESFLKQSDQFELITKLKPQIQFMSGMRGTTNTGIGRAIVLCILGDFNLHFRFRSISNELNADSKHALREIVLLERRIHYVEQFRKIMGHWHSFHLPFAIFMYLAALIHVASALLFRVV